VITLSLSRVPLEVIVERFATPEIPVPVIEPEYVTELEVDVKVVLTTIFPAVEDPLVNVNDCNLVVEPLIGPPLITIPGTRNPVSPVNACVVLFVLSAITNVADGGVGVPVTSKLALILLTSLRAGQKPPPE
jgi:hypothetical protein